MDHYAFPTRFRALHDEAVRRYAAGHRTAAGLLPPTDEAWLAANGLSPQNLFDYAEDCANYGEPGPEQALAIELVRRDYFWNAQDGKPSGRVIDADTLPLNEADTEALIDPLALALLEADTKAIEDGLNQFERRVNEYRDGDFKNKLKDILAKCRAVTKDVSEIRTTLKNEYESALNDAGLR